MPLYEYECDTQHHRFEVIQKFSDAPIAVCPTCGSSVHKLISAPAFQLKGTGWYITDYARKDNGGTAEKAASGLEKESAAPAAEKSDKGDSTPKKDVAPAAPSSSDKSSKD